MTTNPTVANSGHPEGHTVAVDASSVEPADIERLRSNFPGVRFTSSSIPSEWDDLVRDATIVFGKRLPRHVIVDAPRLRWVQAGTAGVDGVLKLGPWPSHIALTNARGVHGIPISEQLVAMMLAFSTRLHVLIRAQIERRSVAREVVSTKWELSGQTLLVIGLGDIGGSLAIRAEALGMHVIGVKRQPGHVPGCHRVVGLDHLDEVLPMADHVALCLPLTPETRHVIDATRIALIRDGAHVYNVGRGSLIDGTALRAALASGRLGGAGLDCVEPSDTPDPDDVLWEMPNVILGQHTSGHSPSNSRAITSLFSDNLRRFLAEEPLENRVDPIRGY